MQNSLMLLWSKVAEESATRCRTSTTMDLKTVHRRVKGEGFSFLTITLPSFGKDFERCLDQKRIVPNSFLGFSRWKGLPRFLGGFLELVFDRNTGRLLDVPDIDAIQAIRQLTLMFGKILVPCSDTRTRAAMLKYIECEQDVVSYDANFTGPYKDLFERTSQLLFSSCFTAVDREIYYGNIRGKHGPGQTADRTRGNAKYDLLIWTERLESIFPSGEMLLPNWSHWERFENVHILEPGSEIPVKVVPVPKTLKTPRIIAMEPTCMQFVQQGIYEILLEKLMWTNHPQKGRIPSLVSSFIGFDDQTPNQRMALEGSLSGELATLDLSEASDRVSNQHVCALLNNHPHFREGVLASRSQKADVPGHGIISLAKFASMGSALCFPFEAMVFLTIIFAAIAKELNRPLTTKDLLAFRGKVRVYGDDIIVPVDYVRPVVEYLEALGLKVNSSKSFWTGKFRESCGKDYYDGFDVTTVKVRRKFPLQLGQAQEAISLVSLRNQLYFAGYWQTVKWLDDRIRRILKYYPTVLPSSRALGRHSFLGFETQRMCPNLHAPLVKGYVISARIPPSYLDGSGALHKFFHKRGILPDADGKHLERAGRPVAVDIKPRWVSPF